MMSISRGIIRGTAMGIALAGLAGCIEDSSSSSKSSSSTLQSGVAVTASIDYDKWRHYTIDVPDNATRLRVDLAITSQEGDVDLIVNHGTRPTEEMWWNDEEDCWDWATPSWSATCDSQWDFELKTGTYHIAAWGDYRPSSSYSLIATITTANSRTSTGQDDTSYPARKIALQYLKQKTGPGGKTIKTSDRAYPESGVVQIEKDDDSYRFYFGSDATTPAVLSIDHNGQWTHYDSWEAFEAEMAAQ